LSIRAVKGRFANSLQMAGMAQELSRHFGGQEIYFKNKLVHVEHHRSHLASAFFASPFEKAACLSLDGSGDFSTTMTAIGEDNELRILDSNDFPHSLGIFYTAFTQFLGFPYYGDEYKVMGMAPYGKPDRVAEISKMIHLKDNGLFSLDFSYLNNPAKGVISYEQHIPTVAPLFGKKMEEIFGISRKPGEALTQYHKDLAASVQKVTEATIFHILEHLHQQTGLDRLCLAGGVAQNSVANGKITRNTGFKQVYIPSAGHDAGISMGAALFVQHAIKKYERQPAVYSAYTGSHFSNEEIENWLKQKEISYLKLNEVELMQQVTDCLIDGGVVGWMQGAAEFGPRALGGRSILADPRRSDAKELINSKIKRRESFRPFAPSILKEFVGEYFEVDEPVPFMEKVFPIRKEKQELIPAVTHVDGTGRLQTVDKLVSPRYYALIHRFYEKTGVPILLNTSFNENEPIVNSPSDAYACFERTEMDMLVMENIIIRR
jgi:carbamoyltransferase